MIFLARKLHLLLFHVILRFANGNQTDHGMPAKGRYFFDPIEPHVVRTPPENAWTTYEECPNYQNTNGVILEYRDTDTEYGVLYGVNLLCEDGTIISSGKVSVPDGSSIVLMTTKPQTCPNDQFLGGINLKSSNEAGLIDAEMVCAGLKQNANNTFTYMLTSLNGHGEFSDMGRWGNESYCQSSDGWMHQVRGIITAVGEEGLLGVKLQCSV